MRTRSRYPVVEKLCLPHWLRGLSVFWTWFPMAPGTGLATSSPIVRNHGASWAPGHCRWVGLSFLKLHPLALLAEGSNLQAECGIVWCGLVTRHSVSLLCWGCLPTQTLLVEVSSHLPLPGSLGGPASDSLPIYFS